MEGHEMNEKKSKLFLRRGLLWTRLLLSVALVMGICVFIEMISFNHNHVIDLTPGKKYSLTDKTLRILDSLKGDVKIITFYKLGEREQNAAVLELFATASPKIKYRLIDMDRNPGKARMYEASHSGDTRIEYTGKSRKIPAPSEDLIVSALLQMTQDIRKVILRSKGHGERDKFQSLGNELRKDEWEIEDLPLAEKESIPLKDRSVLLINDPQKDFYESEISVLTDFMQKGGKIVLLLEPYGKRPNLEHFLRQYHIILENDILIDKENKLYGGDYFAPIIPYIARTPFTGEMRSPLLFSTARSVRVDRALDFKMSTRDIASSSDHSWARVGERPTESESDDFREGIDQPGPVPVAVWVTLIEKEAQPTETQGELICIGDSDFVSNNFLDAMGNKDFFLNILEWLARENPLISIRGKKFQYPYHYLTASQGRFVFWICVVVLPVIFLIAGVIIITYRRVKG